MRVKIGDYLKRSTGKISKLIQCNTSVNTKHNILREESIFSFISELRERLGILQACHRPFV